jgi:hypothetical protein
MRAKLKHLFELYGRVGLGVYGVLMVVTYLGSYLVLQAGLHRLLPESVLAWLPANATSFVGAYALYKGLQPSRIAAALVITPVVARWLGRVPAAPPAEEA